MIEEKYIPFREYQTYVRIVKEDDQDSVPILLLHGGPGSTHNYFVLRFYWIRLSLHRWRSCI